MDLTWITFMFLPLALIFTLVFSIGILIFLFYSLLRDAEERKRGTESTKNQIVKVGKLSSIGQRVRSLKTIFKFSIRKRRKVTNATESSGIKQDSTEIPSTFSDMKETPKNPVPIQPISNEAQKISEDTVSKSISSVGERISKPSKSDKTTPDVTRSEVEKSLDASNEQTQIKAKPVENLSELDKIMKNKTVVSEQNKIEVSEKSEQPPHKPPELTTDSDDVVALLGGIKSIKEEKQDDIFRVSQSVENGLKSPKVEKKEVQKPENNEVESLLRTEEAIDKVEEIQDQFLELRTSLVQLKKTLKKLSEKEDSAEKSEQ